jgi:uncharacterized protein (DUF2147 family)
MKSTTCRLAALPPVSCRLAALPLVALVLALTARPAVAQATIAGTWFTEDSSSKVTITNTGGAYTGKVTWLKNPAAVDAKNSDATLRTRPIMGIDVLTGCTGDATQAKGCRIYVPKRGSTYNAELAIDKDGTLKVKVKAGVGGKTQTWTRASS